MTGKLLQFLSILTHLLLVIEVGHHGATRFVEVAVVVDGREMELAPKGRVYPCKHHVEDMVVPFHGSLLNDATLLEQVIDNSAPANFVCLVEIDLHPLSKSRGVVITERLCVSEGLEYRVALHDLVGNGLRSVWIRDS